MTSRNKIQLAKRIDRLIAKWLRATGRDEARAKDVMPLLIQNEVFRRDHRQDLPLRKLLRDLQRSGDLSVMRTVRPERKKKNTLWYFTLREPVGPVEPGPEGESPPRKRPRPVKSRESPSSSLVDETLGDSKLFVLPFPYRSHALARAYMRQLRKLLRKAES